MTFAEQLKSHRQRLGLNQSEASAFLEISKRTLEYWESGKEPIVVAKEGAIARLISKTDAKPPMT